MIIVFFREGSGGGFKVESGFGIKVVLVIFLRLFLEFWICFFELNCVKL